MTMKNISLPEVNLSVDEVDNLKKMVLRTAEFGLDFERSITLSKIETINKQKSQLFRGSRVTSNNFQDAYKDFYRMISCLLTCHSVFPFYTEENVRRLECTSPDELAFVKFAESIGYKLEFRNENEVAFSSPQLTESKRNIKMKHEQSVRQVHYFSILREFKFDSTRQRHGLILRHVKTVNKSIRDIESSARKR